ncbi:MAG: flagellar protein FlgN [Casimicrobiaceae bacterium]
MSVLPKTLDAVIAAEIDGYASLLALLHDETRALCTGDVGVLERQAEEKLQHVRSLERLFAERQHLAPPAQDPQVPAQRDEMLRLLLERAGEAKRVNALNGRLIDRHQQYASRSLAALRDAAGQPSLYGANGQSSQIVPSVRRVCA